MTKFVQRDGSNKIIADFNRPQPGIAEEAIDETSQEFVQYATLRDNPVLSYDEARNKAYNQQGCDAHSLVIALWERIVENRPESSVDIEATRQQIKIDNPKP